MTVEQLDLIRADFVTADDFEGLQIAAVKLIDGLKDDAAHAAMFKPDGDDPLRQLLREAFDLLNDHDSRINLQDWNREAKKWL